MDVIAIIPARYASTRFPGKPLVKATGKYLIQHVYERARSARRISRVIVATDDVRIEAAVREFGGEVMLTRTDHPSGTDRIAEVVRRLEQDSGASCDSGGRDDRGVNQGGAADGAGLVGRTHAAGALEPDVLRGQPWSAVPASSAADPQPAWSADPLAWSELGPDGLAPVDDIILNVQGDEPEIEPAYLDRLADRLLRESPDCPMATLACPFPAGADPRDPNAVKVVTNSAGRALYFSRSLIPYPRDGGGGAAPPLLHLGVYAYRRAFLLQLATWTPGVLEQIEKLEQLRVLERGTALAVETVEHACVGIDTPQDYEEFVARWRKTSCE